MSRASRISFASLLLTLLGTSAAQAQGTCDRACLRAMLESYLDAVVDDDPGSAALAVGIRQTENAINFAPGRGVWQSVTALGEVQRFYIDEVSGQAAYFGTVEEGNDTAIVTVRVRVENRELTEAEWYVARENDSGLNGPRQPGGPPANLHNPGYLAQNPVGEVRDCLAGLENFNLSMVVARRIPVVDVEAQVVLTFGVFIRRPGAPAPRPAGPDRRRRATSSANGSSSTARRSARFTRRCSIRPPHWRCRTGRRSSATGRWRRRSCRRPIAEQAPVTGSSAGPLDDLGVSALGPAVSSAGKARRRAD